ncbi:hypothetical protein LguiB_028160 [Lonicera macranthoides]
MKMSRTKFPREPNSLDVKLHAKSYARLFSLFNKSVKLVHTRGLLITVPEEQALVENVFSLLSAKANNGSAIL